MKPADGPIRVCHVSLNLMTGGLERMLVDFARFHDRERVIPEFLSLRDELGQPAKDIEAAGGTVHVLPKGGRLEQFKALRALFNERQIGVVNTHNANPLVNVTLPARWSWAQAVVNTWHGQQVNRTPKVRVASRLMARLNHRVIAVSDNTLRHMQEVDGLPARLLRRIYNGIDTSVFANSGPRVEGPPTAVTVCRMCDEKDLPGMLAAVRLAAETVPDLRLRVVGDGPLMGAMIELVTELQLRDRVQLLGHRDDVPALLADSSFYVCSSWSEGLSLALIEAMAVGLPMVVTDAGGNGEIVQDGACGYVVPTRDPEALAAAMVRLCSKRDRWAAMGEAAHARAVEVFDTRRMVRDYEELYRELLG